MVVKDKQGREIKVGTYVIYPTTGTIGEVLDMEEKMEKHGYYYNMMN